MRRATPLLLFLLVFSLSATSASALQLSASQQLALQTPAAGEHIVLRFAAEGGLRMGDLGPESLRAGAAAGFEARLGALVPAARLERRFSLSARALDALRARVGGDLVDLNRYAQLSGLAGLDRAARIELLRALLADPAVDLAWLEPVAVPAALGFDAFTGRYERTDAKAPAPLGDRETDDFSALQGYLNDAPEGVGAWSVAGVPGALGPTVKVIDIEGAWLWAHEDLPDPFVALGGEIQDLGWRNHGTAVLGEIRGTDNGLGVRGITPLASVGASSIAEQSTADAILNAGAAASPGDILLIELHAPGPNANGSGQFGYVPMEFWQDNFDAIRTVTALGVIVCEAAGNGSQDLDQPVYQGLFDRSLRDSGAIMCGATDGSSLLPAWFTNYGARVDLHGWGYSVVTCGYGTLQGDPLPEEEWYASGFSGTSSASPIVVGSVAALQGMVESAYGFSLDARMARGLLVASGTPQEQPEIHIGPRPNLPAAWTRVNTVGLARVSGTITDAGSAAPLAGVALSIPGVDLVASTDALGRYAIVLEPGDFYSLFASDFFHEEVYTDFTLADGQDLVLDVALPGLPLEEVRGRIQTEDALPLGGVTVSPVGVPVGSALSGGDGSFNLADVPAGADFPLLAGGLPGHGAAWTPGLYLTDLPGGRGDLVFSLLLPDADYGFEGDDQGFAPEGDPIWTRGVPGAGGPPAAFGGAHCWGVGMGGDYGDDQFGSLLSPTVDTTGSPLLQLSFHIWRGTESGFDGVRVQAWKAGTWQTVVPEGGYTDLLLGGLGNSPGWSGVSSDWEPVVFDLTEFRAVDFRFRLDFGSDGGVVGEGFWFDDVALFGGSTVTDAGDGFAAPAAAGLSAWPNPFNPSTRIRWSLPAPGALRVDIHDLQGRLQRRLLDGRAASARGSLSWDGRDDAGRALPSGVYLVRLSGEAGATASARLILLK